MAQKLILESTLSNIADAIRSKDGTTELIDPADFAARITAISTGIAEPKAIVVVEAPAGSDVTATNGTDTITGTVGATESFFLLLPSSGAWTVTLTVDGTPQVNNLTLTDYGYAIVKNNPALALIDIAVAAGSLSSLSWTEIETIADSLASGLTPKEKGMQLLGLSKEFKYNSKNTRYAFVIGVLQDYLNITPRGLTFWCVGDETPFVHSKGNTLVIDTDNDSIFGNSSSNAGGWGGTGRGDVLRERLQSGGSIYNAMPSEITAVIKPKTTYYGPTYSSTNINISNVQDDLFILSAKELLNIDNGNEYNSYYDTPFWQYEGTGAAHNEQYQLFSKEGISFSDTSKLGHVTNYSWWLRTCGTGSSKNFMIIKGNGDLYRESAGNGEYYTICFCV